MQIRIEGSDLPGISCNPGAGPTDRHQNVHVGVQRRRHADELLGLVRGDAPAATWVIEADPVPTPAGIDLKGPHIEGPPAGRFVYLSWGDVDTDAHFVMFRRAKLMLDAIAPDVLDRAIAAGVLVGRLGLRDRQGNPLCAAVRPPLIEWSAGAR